MPSAHSVPLARVRALRRSSAARARVRRAAADARLDQLDEGPREEPHIVVLAAALGGRERLGVAAVPVAQQGGRPLVDAQRHALASRRHGGRHRLDQLAPVGFVALPRGQHQRRVLQRCHVGRERDGVGLLDQRRSGAERSRMDMERRAIRDRHREHAERARLPRDAHAARREHVPELVVPEILGEATRQPQPTHVSRGQLVRAAKRVQRAPERRHAGRVALGEPRRQAVEEQVDRPWRLRRRRRSQSGLGRLADAPACRRGDRRTSPPPSPRDGSREPSRRRAARGAGRHRAAAPERPCRACGRTRSPRATAPTARAEARRAAQARRSPAARAPRPMPRHRTSPARQPGPASPAPPDRASARPRAPGTPQPPPRPHGPAPGRPSAPARRPPPRRQPPPREHDATPGDRDRYPDRSPPPAPRCTARRSETTAAR